MFFETTLMVALCIPEDTLKCKEYCVKIESTSDLIFFLNILDPIFLERMIRKFNC